MANNKALGLFASVLIAWIFTVIGVATVDDGWMDASGGVGWLEVGSTGAKTYDVGNNSLVIPGVFCIVSMSVGLVPLISFLGTGLEIASLSSPGLFKAGAGICAFNAVLAFVGGIIVVAELEDKTDWVVYLVWISIIFWAIGCAAFGGAGDGTNNNAVHPTNSNNNNNNNNNNGAGDVEAPSGEPAMSEEERLARLAEQPPGM